MDNLVKYRLGNAHEKIESAEILLNAGKYKDSIGRSYYAIFSAVRAVLALEHVKFSKYLQTAFQIRNVCDYDDFFVASRQDAVLQLGQAREFLEAVKAYLDVKD